MPDADAWQDRRMARNTRIYATALLGLAVLVGAGAVFLAWHYVGFYGTATGSWREGALEGLKLAALPLLAAGALAAVAVWLARPSALMLNLAAAAVVLSVFAVAVVGGFASVAS